MIYWELFWGFLRVGCFAFGGGYGAIPLIRDVVFSHGWLSDEALTYMIAVGESTPGPIAVNLATYVGCSQAGALGGGLATFAVVLPSFLITIAFLLLFDVLIKNRWFSSAMDGIRPCVTGIILATGLTMIRNNISVTDPKTLVITGILAAVMFGSRPILKKKVSPIGLIILAACLGIVLY